MNLKRTFGAILTVLGIIGLIYTGVQIIQHTGAATTLIVVGLIAIVVMSPVSDMVRPGSSISASVSSFIRLDARLSVSGIKPLSCVCL